MLRTQGDGSIVLGLTSLSETVNPSIHKVTTYSYNAQQMLQSITDPLGNSETYSYNNLGEMISKEDRNDSWIEYRYDGLGRLTGVDAYSGYDLQLENISYSYDYMGNVTQMVDNSGTTYYTYNNKGLLATETKGGAVKDYTYDALGKKTSFRLRYDNLDHTVAYTYDHNNRLKTVTDGSDVTTYNYNNKGQLTSRNTKEGTTTLTASQYTYNLAGLPITKVNKRSSTQGDGSIVL